MNLLLYEIKRFFKRLRWRLFPPSEKDFDNTIRQHLEQHLYARVMSIDECIAEIKNKGKSVARYGDGEFRLCFGRGIYFQKHHPLLQKRLREILLSESEKCLVGIPELKLQTTPFWKRYWYENLEDIETLLSKNYRYGHQGISRESTAAQVMQLAEVWSNRTAVIVIGKNSRFVLDDRLFGGVRQTVFIYGPAEHAFEQYDIILASVLAEAKKYEDCIVIIALGPAATVLAYDLAERGIQALDIGHITNHYNNVTGMSSVSPEKLPVSF